MKALELDQALRKTGPASLYLIAGEEDLLRDQSVARIKAAVATEAGEGLEAFNSDLFYGDETEAAEILACAGSVSVFAPRRLVLVKGAEKLPARETEALLPYVKSPSESTTLVFVAAKLDGRLKFSQALKERAVLVDCSALPPSQVGDWVRQEANRLGVRLTEDAIDLLKELAGESLNTVRRELEKLAAYVPTGQVAGPEAVEAVRGGQPGASVFDLTAAIGGRDPGRALRILARNLETGEAPLRILGSLVWQYRRIWKAKDLMKQGESDAGLARALGIPPFRLREFLGQLRYFSEPHLQAAFRMFLETDSNLKGGSAGSPERVLETLLLALSTDARKPDAGRSLRSHPAGPPAGPPPQRPAGSPAPRSGKTKPIQTVRTVRSGKAPPR